LISKLEESQYIRIQPLFHELRYNLVIDSILDGHSRASVYADNPSKPKSALIWNNQEALLVAGEVNNEAFNTDLRALVLEEISPDAQLRDVPELVWQYHPKPWNKILSQTFSTLEGSRVLRRYYNFDRPRFNWRDRLPAGHRILPINASLMEGSSPGGNQQVTAWIESHWLTKENFLDRGFGYCLVAKGEILSSCLSIYASGKDYELGLSTNPTYRDKGSDMLAAAACVEHCSQRDLTPHWHCWNDDTAAITIAEQVGFENPVKYPVYRLKLKSDQN
jgi:RimJ/RimL family protein N-acetyltransferase